MYSHKEQNYIGGLLWSGWETVSAKKNLFNGDLSDTAGVEEHESKVTGCLGKNLLHVKQPYQCLLVSFGWFWQSQ